MSILSLEFLVFAACAVLLYYCLPMKIRWMVLLAASAVYTALAGWQCVAHLSAVCLLMWGGALWLQRLSRPSPAPENSEGPVPSGSADANRTKRRALLAVLLILDLGAMIFLKYWPALSGAALILPLGLSYFTFQSAGYLVDVYRGKAEARKNPLEAWLFIGYFPQLAQGPISTWKELGDRLLTGHRFEPENICSGFTLLLWGYFKKMVIADRLAAATDALVTGEGLPGWFILGGVILYTVRLYMDFSGGMDVIRGLSRMVGIELPENFRRPFFAKSVSEYWRRWHITLGSWFRSCLLYPLTTCRAGIALGRLASGAFGKKTGRTVPSALATFLVFLLIGVWHTANWNAVVYGAYFGLVMASSMLLEPFWKKLRTGMKLPKGGWMTPVRLVRTLILILLAQYFAFTPNPGLGWSLLQGTFRAWDFSGFSARAAAVMAPLEWAIAGGGCLAVLAVDFLCERKKDVCGWLSKPNRFFIRWPALLLLILAVTTFGIYGSGYDGAAFLYTRF